MAEIDVLYNAMANKNSQALYTCLLFMMNVRVIES